MQRRSNFSTNIREKLLPLNQNLLRNFRCLQFLSWSQEVRRTNWIHGFY